ncbi:MAG TPA: hypothetical protein VM097_08285 [Mycobacteriales bacterium]|nr:hypothetical protein [Mycobacteriales bacterium]
MRTTELGAKTLGVWTRQAALAVQTPGQVDHLLASGVWQQLLPGVYADAGFERDPLQRAVAAVMATGDAVARAPGQRVRALACGRTAARVHGLPLIDDDDPATGAAEHHIDDVHTFRARSGRSLPVALGNRQLLRHRLSLLQDDVVRHPCGLLLTSPLRTAVDCTRLLTHEATVCLLDDGLRRGLFTTADLEAAVSAREGWPGVRALAAAVRAADGRAESPGESLARMLLLPAVPGLVPQVRVKDDHGRVVARLDLGEEQLLLGIEVDGKRGHAGAQMVAKDRRRDRRTQALGWRVERCTWHELRTRPGEVLARVPRHAA